MKKAARPKKWAGTGRRIKVAREARHLTIRELASAVGVSFGLVSAWERGTAGPQGEKIGLLADTLGVTPTFIMLSDPEETAVFEKAEAFRAQEAVRIKQAKADALASEKAKKAVALLELQKAAARKDRERKEAQRASAAKVKQQLDYLEKLNPLPAPRPPRKCEECGSLNLLPVGNLCGRCWNA